MPTLFRHRLLHFVDFSTMKTLVDSSPTVLLKRAFSIVAIENLNIAGLAFGVFGKEKNKDRSWIPTSVQSGGACVVRGMIVLWNHSPACRPTVKYRQ